MTDDSIIMGTILVEDPTPGGETVPMGTAIVEATPIPGGVPVVDAIPYPSVPVSQNVYAANVVQTVPQPPPPPTFVPPPAPVVIAQPAPVVQTVAVTCPPGVGPGGALQVQVGAQLVQVQVPAGVSPGMAFHVQVQLPPSQQQQPQQQQPPPPPAPAFALPPTKPYKYRNRRDHYHDDYLLYGFGGLGAYYYYSAYQYDYYCMYDRPYHYHHYSYGYNDAYYNDTYYANDPAFDDAVLADDADVYDDAVGDAYGAETVIDYDEADFDAQLDALEANEADISAGGDGGDGGGDGVDMYGGAGPTDLPDGGRGPGETVDKLKAAARQRKVYADNLTRAMRTSAPHAAAQKANAAREAAKRHRAASMAHEDVSDTIEKLWQQMIDLAEESVLGEISALEHPMRPRVLAPARAPGALQPPATGEEAAPITLVAQCSLDRLDRLIAQLASWRGPASVALYIESPQGSEAAAQAESEAVRRLRSAASETAIDTHRLVVSILYRASSSSLEQEANAEMPLYPINALRNLAMSHAPTELVFLLDVDFVPSAGLLRELGRDHRLLHQLRTSRTALVIPAFEVSPDHRLPRQQAALSSLLGGCSPPAASPFHCSHFPAGHMPTDFARWLTASERYTVDYALNYEPYIIANRRWLPPYDERFRGYGHNKISHVYAVAAAGATFEVMPRHFVCAHEHPKSTSWAATFGSAADPRHRMRVAAIWRRVQRDAPLPTTLTKAEPKSSPADSAVPAASDKTGLSTLNEQPAAERKRRAGPMGCAPIEKRRCPSVGSHRNAVECRG